MGLIASEVNKTGDKNQFKGGRGPRRLLGDEVQLQIIPSHRGRGLLEGSRF